jgi:hypothetical protein
MMRSGGMRWFFLLCVLTACGRVPNNTNRAITSDHPDDIRGVTYSSEDLELSAGGSFHSITLSYPDEAPCDAITFSPDSFKSAIKKDLKALASLKGGAGSPLHQEIFRGPVEGETYVSWFTDRIKRIVYSPCMNSERIIAAASSRGDMFVAGRYFDARSVNDAQGVSDPQLYRLSVLLHEARHVEGFDHVACTLKKKVSGDPFALPNSYDTDNCDNTEVGAYGTQVIFMYNVAQFHPEIQLIPKNLSSARRITSSESRLRLATDLRLIPPA